MKDYAVHLAAGARYIGSAWRGRPRSGAGARNHRLVIHELLITLLVLMRAPVTARIGLRLRSSGAVSNARMHRLPEAKLLIDQQENSQS
jgi:hypothetical protein